MPKATPLEMTRIGMLTPSSNTVLEPMLARMVASAPGISVHFSRFPVLEIALSGRALDQFAEDRMVEAADLLGHAKVDVIAWNGTSASWLGFQRDVALCRKIEGATGIRATTSVLAFRDVFWLTGARRVGLVTPYTRDVQDKIIANWADAGFACSAERCLGLSDNFSFAEVTEETIEGMVRAVILEGCDAVAIVCTNMRGAALVSRLEAQLNVPIYDSVAVALWRSLLMADTDMSELASWGSVFSLGYKNVGRPTVADIAL
jgi:maleate isomerase